VVSPAIARLCAESRCSNVHTYADVSHESMFVRAYVCPALNDMYCTVPPVSQARTWRLLPLPARTRPATLVGRRQQKRCAMLHCNAHGPATLMRDASPAHNLSRCMQLCGQPDKQRPCCPSCPPRPPGKRCSGVVSTCRALHKSRGAKSLCSFYNTPAAVSFWTSTPFEAAAAVSSPPPKNVPPMNTLGTLRPPVSSASASWIAEPSASLSSCAHARCVSVSIQG
jgi:hypothetical protein